MEIISYATVCSNQRPKIILKGSRKNRVHRFEKSFVVFKKTNFLFIFKNFKTHLWCALILLFAIFFLFSINKIISFAKNYATPLLLSDSRQDEMEFLQKAMSALALSENDGIDCEGNVLGAPQKNFFCEKVSFQNYTVKEGDTIGAVARKFSLKNVSTIIALNNIENVRQIFAGQKLIIPSTDGLIHTVTQGNTLEGLSAKYNVPLEDLLDANDLESTKVNFGQKIFIPGARLDKEILRRAMGEDWSVPLKAKWRLTSKCEWRINPVTGTGKQFHPGIDMACPKGTPIFAAQGGKILASGVSRVYGNYIIIDHGNGYQTLYGHMSKRLCEKNERVSQNQKIGLVGSTGYSTGPHLHWTVYKNGKVIDPETLLK